MLQHNIVTFQNRNWSINGEILCLLSSYVVTMQITKDATIHEYTIQKRMDIL